VDFSRKISPVGAVFEAVAKDWGGARDGGLMDWWIDGLMRHVRLLAAA
jgi:hypothetical protein